MDAKQVMEQIELAVNGIPYADIPFGGTMQYRGQSSKMVIEAFGEVVRAQDLLAALYQVKARLTGVGTIHDGSGEGAGDEEVKG